MSQGGTDAGGYEYRGQLSQSIPTEAVGIPGLELVRSRQAERLHGINTGTPIGWSADGLTEDPLEIASTATVSVSECYVKS